MVRETFFYGHQLNAVDAKGRVSVPAIFRTQIERRAKEDGVDDPVKELTIAPHRNRDRLIAYDARGLSLLTSVIQVGIGDLPASARRVAQDAALRLELPALAPVAFDSAGRMVLSPILRKVGKIGDLAFFVGMGDSIEIWSPENARVGFADNPGMLEMLDLYLEERDAS